MLTHQFEVTVVDLAGHCPQHRVGDRVVFREEMLGPQWGTMQFFCVHSVNQMCDAVMKLWRGGTDGDTIRIPCSRHCVCTFEVKVSILNQPGETPRAGANL